MPKSGNTFFKIMIKQNTIISLNFGHKSYFWEIRVSKYKQMLDCCSTQDLHKITYDFCGKPKINIWSIFVFHHVPSTRNCLQLIMNGGVMNGLWTPLSNLIAPSRKRFRGKTTYRGKVSNQYFVIGWVNL